MKEYFLIGQWRVIDESDYIYEHVEECRLSIGLLTDEEKEFFEKKTDIMEVFNYALRKVADISENTWEIDLFCIDNIPLTLLEDKEKHVDGLKKFDNLCRTRSIKLPTGARILRRTNIDSHMKVLRNIADKIRNLRQIGHTTMDVSLEKSDMNLAKVFISYAWNDNIKKEVGDLVQWLNKQKGIETISDHYLSGVAPKDGWYAWMQHNVEDADIVLCICGEVYKKAFEKREGGGKGSTWEGAIITTDLYESFCRNEKYFPILQKSNDRQFIPSLLKAWDSGVALAEWDRILHIIYEIRHRQATVTPVFQNNNQGSGTEVKNQESHDLQLEHIKPVQEEIPHSILEDANKPYSSLDGKFLTFSKALSDDHRSIANYRRQLIEAIVDHADPHFIEAQHERNICDNDKIIDIIYNDNKKLRHASKIIAQWVLLEAGMRQQDELIHELNDLFDKILGFTDLPSGYMGGYGYWWFDSQKIFVYESFIYTIAALLAARSYSAIYSLLSASFISPNEGLRKNGLDNYGIIYPELYLFDKHYGRAMQTPCPLGTYVLDGIDLNMQANIVLADIILYLYSTMKSFDLPWVPQVFLLPESREKNIPFFIRASRHRTFQNLSEMLGSVGRDRIKEVIQLCQNSFEQFAKGGVRGNMDFTYLLNVANLDTIK